MPKSKEQMHKELLDRIQILEDVIQKANAYLVTGEHADWSGFRALFVSKFKNGRKVPPHKDWVKNVFLPRQEKELDRVERILERLG